MQQLFRKYLRKAGYDLVGFKTFKGIADPIIPWENDAAFISLYNTVLPHTLVDRKRLYMLWQLSKKAASLKGNFAECGVYKGGTALLLSKIKPANVVLHLFDTFEGMPTTNPEKDFHEAGDFKETTYDAVNNLLNGFENISIHKGFFPQTAVGLEDELFSFVHCDMDIYQSVLDCCTFFYPKLSKGGVLLFDDYGSASCPGALEAVSEFCKSQGIYEIYLPTGQAVIIKY